MSGYRQAEERKARRYAVMVCFLIAACFLLAGWYENYVPAVQFDDRVPAQVVQVRR